eukprot:CAMPEP_0198446250 /NCGR_PEP_ID=MMETSP1453-20131121/1182_1 /TAXON_ID=1461543 ORGANISM="Unidentified sp., Strain RCC701" /NCGR_SAMPLE_ID=MMETSP1453 /ASSEMBLY_ACC=CAM_ASM_001118 /LENGTH=46 /DNA_ID= /DNA_START= /DNA_END= /DNA_ORIENTATION=
MTAKRHAAATTHKAVIAVVSHMTELLLNSSSLELVLAKAVAEVAMN